MKDLTLKDDLIPADSLEVKDRFEGELMLRAITGPEGHQPIVLKARKVRQLRDHLTRWLQENS